MGYTKNLNLPIIISALLISIFIISMLCIHPNLIKAGTQANIVATNTPNTGISDSSFTCDIPIIKGRTEMANPSKMQGLDGYTVIYLGYSQYSQNILCAISDFLVASGNNNFLVKSN